MTKHDTWATLKPNNPLSEIIHLFPDGQLPMRDPFPMETGRDAEGGIVNLFCIDIERLQSSQSLAIATLYARKFNVCIDLIISDATGKGGFALNAQHIERLFCGPEGYQRTKEVADFHDRYLQPTPEQFLNFMEDQRKKWVEGDEEPPPLPGYIEGFDPRLRTPELEEALARHQIERQLAGYSVFDVLSGRAMVDILNKQNPNAEYELVDWGELLDD